MDKWGWHWSDGSTWRKAIEDSKPPEIIIRGVPILFQGEIRNVMSSNSVWTRAEIRMMVALMDNRRWRYRFWRFVWNVQRWGNRQRRKVAKLLGRME